MHACESFHTIWEKNYVTVSLTVNKLLRDIVKYIAKYCIN